VIHVQIPIPEGHDLDGTLYGDNGGETPAIIYCHGMLSNKDGYKVQRLGPGLAEKGYSLLAFTFSGASPAGMTYQHLSILNEVKELAAAVGWMRSRGYDRLHLVGSSLGGLIVLIYASGWDPALCALTTLATPIDLEEAFESWQVPPAEKLDPEGYTIIEGVSINNRFFIEGYNLDIPSCLKRIDLPLQVIHGSEDETVPFSNASRLVSLIPDKVEQVTIDGGDHSLIRREWLNIIQQRILEWTSFCKS
jgi:pimeloyl-ACP methyl ester carboxylesterase